MAVAGHLSVLAGGAVDRYIDSAFRFRPNSILSTFHAESHGKN